MNLVDPAKPVDESDDQSPHVPSVPVVATFKIEKFADGNLSYSSGGPDSDVLGLLEFGKIIVHDKTRLHLAQQASAQAAQAAQLAAEEPNPAS